MSPMAIDAINLAQYIWTVFIMMIIINKLISQNDIDPLGLDSALVIILMSGWTDDKRHFN